jgi:trehalose 6-phosphate phosphatase
MNAESQQPPPLTRDVALFLDFDGTLVDIAPTPDAVTVAEALPARLRHVAWLLNGALAVVSGRPITSIDRFLGRAVHCVAGIHGAERRTALGHVLRSDIGAGALQLFRQQLAALPRSNPGILVEDKEVSIAVHFREAPDAADLCRRAVDACVAASHGGFERLDGKMVVELKPAGITKVTALCAYMNEAPFAGRRPVFVGDDVTDEGAFVEVSKTNGFGVIVGARAPSAATARLPSVAALHAWLNSLSE